MPRPSPKTERVAAVIEVLADAAGAGLALTELAERIGLNRSSCVHVLAALEVAGVVVREDDRRYHLGPALVRPGQAAAARYPLLAAARPLMRELSARTLLPCVAFEPDGEHARLVQHTWAPGRDPLPVRLGERLPLGPPLGLVFAAWADDATFATWLGRDPDLRPEEERHLRAQRTAVRRLGYVVELAPRSAEPTGLADILLDPSSPYRDRQLHRLLSPAEADDAVLVDPATLGAEAERAVISIGAPVLDRAGAVVASLGLIAFPDPLTGEEIERAGAAVRDGAAAVGDALR